MHTFKYKEAMLLLDLRDNRRSMISGYVLYREVL